MNSNVQILWGSEGIRKAYEMTLKAKKLKIVCLSSDYQKVIGVYFDKIYAPKLFGSTTETWEVLPDVQANREDAKKKDGQKNKVKFIKIEEASESDYMLFEDKAVLISYQSESPYALVIEDRNLVSNLEIQFKYLWNNL